MREAPVARAPRSRSAPLRPALATERAERSVAAHGGALPTPRARMGRGDTGPRGCGGNHAHSTKGPVPVRRADRPAITVRTARSAAGTRESRAESVAVAVADGTAGRAARPGRTVRVHAARPGRPVRCRSRCARKSIEPPPSPAKARSIARGAVSRRCGTSWCRKPGRCPGWRACRSSS